MGSVLVVRQDFLPTTPPAFQQYVNDWFVKREVPGIPCYVASRELSFYHGPYEPRKRQGSAPCHCLDTNEYRISLDQDLNDWICKNLGPNMVELFTPEHSCPCSDD